MSSSVMSDLENGMPVGENGPALKPNHGKKTGVTSGSSFLAARKPAAPFVKLAGQDAGPYHPHSTAASVIEEDASRRNAHHVVVENTYKMAPDPDKRFSCAAVNKIAQTILTEKLTNVKYDPNVCRDLSLQISDDIRQQVKQLGFDRYKIVCVTHIGQKSRQTIRIGSMCCWDRETDNFAEYSFVNGSLFAVTMVFGIYQE